MLFSNFWSNFDLFCRFLVCLIVVVAFVGIAYADDSEDSNTLKCLVQTLKQKGISEDFFESSGTPSGEVNCVALIDAKKTKAYNKIRDKLKADAFFAKYETCIMKGVQNEANDIIVMQREAIKLNGVGVAVWNYFNQKEHLDALKKKVENSINKVASEKCISVY